MRATLPDEVAISAVTAAELAAGPLLAGDPVEAAKRQARLQEVEAKFEPIPFDAAAARSYGLLAAAALRKGPHPRNRFADLLIAATAHTHHLDLYTPQHRRLRWAGRADTSHRGLKGRGGARRCVQGSGVRLPAEAGCVVARSPYDPLTGHRLAATVAVQ
ncbi:MAG: PIN domain-containing protein [Mycobacterium sp.]|nr:PIN domain-containing protein [Mycobacterium sp.]